MTRNLIPTINISSIVNKDFSTKKSIKTINKIKKACVNIGFFQITGHGISKKILKIYAMSVINFLIRLKIIRKNWLQENGTIKIKMFTEVIFQMMLMAKRGLILGT